MRRAGGWILGFAIVAGMAVAAFFGLRPILLRETVRIVFVEHFDRTAQGNAELRDGFLFALNERNRRAGRFRVEPVLDPAYGWIPVPRKDGSVEYIEDRREDPAVIGMIGVPTPPLNSTRTAFPILWCSGGHLEEDEVKPRFCVVPSAERLGRAAAAWAKSRGLDRVLAVGEQFNNVSYAAGQAFIESARAAGLTVTGQIRTFQPYPSLADEILEQKPDLVFFSGDDTPHGKVQEMMATLHARGYTGSIMIADSCGIDSFLEMPARLTEGTLLVSPLPPAPAEFAAAYKAAVGVAPGPHVYTGYLAARTVLETLERPGVKDRESLRAALETLPVFNENGGSTRGCSGYAVRGGKFEFVEFLK